jgi:hypothetical protein
MIFFCEENNWQKEIRPFGRHLLSSCCEKANFGRKSSDKIADDFLSLVVKLNWQKEMRPFGRYLFFLSQS